MTPDTLCKTTLTDALRAELRLYQQEGVQFLAPRNVAMLLDQQGLGKTPTAIRAADLAGAMSINVVCPAIGRIMWQRAFQRWATELHRVRIYSYNELALYDGPPIFGDLLILDEAQRAKNQMAKCTQTIYGYLARGVNCITSRSGMTWLLSGTLTPNGPHELYAHLRALLPQLITHGGRPLLEWEWIDRYFHWYTDQRIQRTVVKTPRDSMLPELKALIRPYFLRRLKKDVLPELPEFATEVVPLDYSGPHFSDADLALIEDVLAMLERDDTEPLSRLPLSTIRRFTGEAKIAPAIDYIESVLDGTEKVVVFAHHRNVIDQLQTALASYGVVVIRGGMTDKAKQRSVDLFQEHPHYRVCIGQITACNSVIDLTAASREIFVEWSFVPGENAQAAERCHRFTTKSAVLASFLTLQGSLDEKVTRIVERKTAAIAALWRH